MSFLINILASVWFLMPAYASVIMPVFARKIDFLNIPVDFNKKISKKRVFGRNKTYRGFFFGILSAIIVAFIQEQLYGFSVIKEIRLLNYSEINLFLLGFLMGFGALFGDLTKSFFKRRLGIKEGWMWFPFDQDDFALGAALFVYPIYKISTYYFFVMVLASLFLHLFCRKVFGRFAE